MTIELVIEARPRDIGAFKVRRTLPSVRRRLVGPFIFFDHMGPIELTRDVTGDVPPHPHIGLATITYLFDGEIVHRDSLGSRQTIRPGDVNWMVAGRGIVHSERAPDDAPAVRRLHGLQTWVALPKSDEDGDPHFEHHAASSLPTLPLPGAELRVIAGTAYGARANVGVRSPTLYVHARLDTDASIDVDEEHEERAVYVVDGAIECENRLFSAGAMMVLHPRTKATLRATEAANVMLIGGERLEGPRFIEWNFVSSSKDRIARAKDDWRADRFPKVPGDEDERIPLPT